ncbi:MAG: hypothetical protein AB8G05_25970 [Oligoflexales bacterium]
MKFIRADKQHNSYIFHQGINKLSDNVRTVYENEFKDEIFYRCFFRRTRRISQTIKKQVPEEFEAKGTCQTGGLYFTDLTHASRWNSYGDPTIVKVPNEARVWLESDKFKADMIDIDFSLNSKLAKLIQRNIYQVSLKSANIYPLDEALESEDESDALFTFSSQIATKIDCWLSSKGKNDQSQTIDTLLKVGFIYGQILRTMKVLNFDFQGSKLFDAYLIIYSVKNTFDFKIPPISTSNNCSQLEKSIGRYASSHNYKPGSETYDKFVQWVLIQYLYNNLVDMLNQIDSNYYKKFDTTINIPNMRESGENPNILFYSQLTSNENLEDKMSEDDLVHESKPSLALQISKNKKDILAFNSNELLQPETKCIHTIIELLEEKAIDNPYLQLIVTPLKKRLSKIPGAL